MNDETISTDVVQETPEPAIPKIPKLIFKSRFGMGAIGFIAHRPAVQRYHIIPLDAPREVTLARDLPRKWAKVCHVGHNTKGRSNPSYIPSYGFRKGDKVTITEAIFYPGAGVFYIFEEGKRGNYMLRMEQIIELNEGE